MENRPNYFAILTPEVRYSQQISPMAKLIYAEITALTNSFGYCIATNKYFAELYGVSQRTIQSNIKSLQENGFITILITTKNRRKIYINFTPPKPKKNRKVPSWLEEYERNFESMVEDL